VERALKASSQRPPLRIRQSSTGLLWRIEVRVIRFNVEWYPFMWAPSLADAMSFADRHYAGCRACQRREAHVNIPRSV
jgi:hypothetical protein